MPFLILGGIIAYVLVWLAIGSNLTRVVGTGSILVLLALAAGLGLAAWGVVSVVYWLRAGRLQFRVDDEPTDLLGRLKTRGTSLELPSFIASGFRYLYLAAESDNDVYAAPRIDYAFAPDAAPEVEAAFAAAVDNSDFDAILATVRSGIVTLNWSNPGGIRSFPNAEAVCTERANLLAERVGVT